MKILHLSSEYTWRGGEQQIAYLLEELRSAGVDNLVAVRKGSEFEKWCRDHDFKYFTLNFKNSLDAASAYRLKQQIKITNPDLIHAHTSKGHGILAIAYALGLKKPSVISRRVDFHLKKLGFSNWKYNIGQIKRIICVSDEIRQIVQKSIKSPERAVTVYSGIDLSRFAAITSSNFLQMKYGLPHNSFLVGNTSAIADHKDYFTFTDTARNVLASGIKDIYFFIIGDGPMKDQILDYVKNSGLEDKIIFTGFLKNIPEILKELDLFLMTSKTEGLGTSVLDAFASGLPVISTNGGGLKETVIHEVTGLQAETGDAEGLAAHVQELYNQPEKRKQLSDNAHEFVKKFTKYNTAAETLKIYESILK